MPEIDCDEIVRPELLAAYFRQDHEPTKIRIFRCFFKLFYEEFKKYTYKFCRNKPYTKYKEEELADVAFNDGLLSFYYFIRTKGYESQRASIKTLLFTFCKYKLMGLITGTGRQSAKQASGNPDTIIEQKGKTIIDNYDRSKDDTDIEDMDAMILKHAFQELGTRCSILIWLRKVYKMGNEDIANIITIETHSEIQPGSVNNEVFKCFKRLKEIVDKLKGGK